MTPVGHASVAYASSALLTGLRSRRARIALVVGGVLPDVDFVLFWAPQFNEWHRVVTHNLSFTTLAALLGMLWARWHGRGSGGEDREWVRVGVALWLGGLLHLLVDSVMDGNPSNGIGVAFAWPLVDRTFSPFNLIPIADDPPTWRELGRMVPAVAYGLLFELPVYAASAVLYFRRRSPRP